jgi:hypothetical protein
MEQRRLRLGDILDDYCPRERRVTNHAIVAMIEEEIKQTRCTTCDAEHPYKGARVPKRRKKETPQLSMPSDDSVPAVPPLPPAPDVESPPPAGAAEVVAAQPPAPEPVAMDEPQPAPLEEQPAVDGPVHRPLIRATLPRPEGQKDTRPVPDFTVRHTQGRPGHGNAGNYRGERMRMRGGNGNGTPNGNRGSRFHGGSGNRAPGGRQPGGRGGPSSGFRNSNGPGGKRGRGPRG